MADLSGQANNKPGGQLIRRLQENSPNPAQLVGFLTLAISGGILLLLTGLTVTASLLSLIFVTPLLVVSSPIWVPVAAIVFAAVSGFLAVSGFGVVAAAVASWIYRYFRGMNPPGSDQFDYARSRFVDTASHVKDYAREYGGSYLQKVKDTAPGA